MANNHRDHSRLIKSMALQQLTARLRPDAPAWVWTDETVFALKSPHAGHRVCISFATTPGCPDYVYIRSSNWRTEDEPCGFVPKMKARAIWLRLVREGFVRDDITEAYSNTAREHKLAAAKARAEAAVDAYYALQP